MGLAKWTEKSPRANNPHNKKKKKNGKGKKSIRERRPGRQRSLEQKLANVRQVAISPPLPSPTLAALHGEKRASRRELAFCNLLVTLTIYVVVLILYSLCFEMFDAVDFLTHI